MFINETYLMLFMTIFIIHLFHKFHNLFCNIFRLLSEGTDVPLCSICKLDFKTLCNWWIIKDSHKKILDIFYY